MRTIIVDLCKYVLKISNLSSGKNVDFFFFFTSVSYVYASQCWLFSIFILTRSLSFQDFGALSFQRSWQLILAIHLNSRLPEQDDLNFVSTFLYLNTQSMSFSFVWRSQRPTFGYLSSESRSSVRTPFRPAIMVVVVVVWCVGWVGVR